jgi:murein DD-endopeptidase MepM/ murein hydrolase activator NlpD
MSRRPHHLWPLALMLLPVGLAAMLIDPETTPAPTLLATPIQTTAGAKQAVQRLALEQLETKTGLLEPGQALSSVLIAAGASPAEAAAVLRDIKGTLDNRALQRGGRYRFEFRRHQLYEMSLVASTREGVPRTVTASRAPNEEDANTPAFVVMVVDAPIETVVAGVAAEVKSSVYTAVVGAGEGPALVDKFVDVFAWSIDFYRQAQTGDQLKMVVEKRFAGVGEDRKFLGYGEVIAAEYTTGLKTHRGFSFHSKDGAVTGYFDEHGESIERTFVQSPMEITHVTSHYGMRFHPVYGQRKKHEGIDYGAPVGTPVWTVADGTITAARFSSSAGNMVTVQHSNGLTSEYFHLSRFAEGAREGTKVKQKQVIGYVGSTGTSTGPHLHFGLMKNGVHVDPIKQQASLPAATPLGLSYHDEFNAWVAPLLARLEALARS